ncbi:hypothetical protein [Paenibacillus kobensis]|uniref:hypothetical protein n=1 Tax=Paenibacillus kobensis TaxID=59841 RepID=UPI001FE9BF82|nr:hypothetical protein [Paenibacillus kobensis]
MAEITIVQTDSEIRSTFELMKQLRPHFAERSDNEYAETIKRMQLQHGYKLAVVFEDG